MAFDSLLLRRLFASGGSATTERIHWRCPFCGYPARSLVYVTVHCLDRYACAGCGVTAVYDEENKNFLWTREVDPSRVGKAQ